MKEKGGFFGNLFKKGSKVEEEDDELDEVPAKVEKVAEAKPVEAPKAPPVRKDITIECEDGGLFRLWETNYAGALLKPDLIFEHGPTPLPMDEMRQVAEEKKLTSWISNEGSTHLKVITDAIKEYKENVKLEKEMAANEDRDPKPVPKPPIDGKAVFTLSTDGMAGWLMLFPPMGKGAMADKGDVQLLLDENKVVNGVNHDYIDNMLARRRYFHLFPVVMGKAPIPGKNGRVTDYYSKERICVFTPDADGNLDYRAQNYFQPVFEDGVICDITLPTEGKPGLNVRGEEVAAKPGEAAKVSVGANTHITEDGTQLVSNVDGDVVYEKGVFLVRSTMQVNGDVDYSTGNINFMGDVHVKGNVRDKFIVRATGSVIVDGLLESAIIDADGDVIIAGGILGDGEGTVRSRGSVRAKFMESCTVFAAQSIHTDYILGSEVYCDGPLMVTSGKGIVMGGTVSVHSYIEVKSIGSPHTGRATILNMGAPPCGGGENFVDAQGIDPAELLLEMANSEETASQLVNCRGKFQNMHVGVVINFARDTLHIEREWNGISVRYDEAEQCILLT